MSTENTKEPFVPTTEAIRQTEVVSEEVSSTNEEGQDASSQTMFFADIGSKKDQKV